MWPFPGSHTGQGGPEITGWVYTGRNDHMMGASPAGYAAAAQAIQQSPAFHAMARSMSHTGDVTGPPAQAPAYGGGPGTAYGGSAQVIQRPLTDMREFPLGFFQAGLAVGESSVISRPQVVFRGERLIVPSVVVAPFFQIVDIKVGNRSQLVNSNSLPAQMFIETAVGVRLSMDTAAVAQDVAIVVNNIAGGATSFSAAIIGTAAQ